MKSSSCLRKVKAEANAKLDRDNDDLIDVIKMPTDNNFSYIKLVTSPFSVILHCKEQVSLLGNKNYNTDTLYLDATGQIS